MYNVNAIVDTPPLNENSKKKLLGLRLELSSFALLSSHFSLAIMLSSNFLYFPVSDTLSSALLKSRNSGEPVGNACKTKVNIFQVISRMQRIK